MGYLTIINTTNKMHLAQVNNTELSTKLYDKRDDFNFEIVNFPFLDGEILAPLPMVYTFHNLFFL